MFRSGSIGLGFGINENLYIGQQSSTELEVGDGQGGLRDLGVRAISASTTVTTAAPSGATADAWKLGSVVTETCTADTTKTVRVEIGGVMVKLAPCQ